MTATKRDHLVDTALELFDRDGFRATGIDRILAESGVAKMTLYNHFRSKDELILAALRRRDERFRNWFMREVERRARTPRERLLAMFDVLEEWFGQDDFSGCMFVKAASEFCGDTKTIRGGVCEHKRLTRNYVHELASAVGARDPDGLADGLALLIEGAVVTAHICGSADPARKARRAAETLVDAAI